MLVDLFCAPLFSHGIHYLGYVCTILPTLHTTAPILHVAVPILCIIMDLFAYYWTDSVSPYFLMPEPLLHTFLLLTDIQWVPGYGR